MKRLAQATVVAVLSTAVALLLAEGIVRLVFPAFDPSGRFAFGYQVGPLTLAVPNRAARQAKNTGDYDVTVRINRRGLRDDKDIALAVPGDLVVVGDSFAWGWGVEEAERFSDLLQAATGRRVYNLATPTDIQGYADLLEYAQFLGGRVGRVLLALCMENDLRVYGPRERPDAAASSLRDWLENRSAAYLFATTAVHRTPWLNDLAVRLGLLIPNFDGMARNSNAPEIVASSADRLQAIARYDTLVVLIPSRALWVGDNRETEDRVHRALVAALAQRGVATLDLRAAWEANGAPLAYHFTNDGHWNPRGHHLAAQVIAERLKKDK